MYIDLEAPMLSLLHVSLVVGMSYKANLFFLHCKCPFMNLLSIRLVVIITSSWVSDGCQFNKTGLLNRSASCNYSSVGVETPPYITISRVNYQQCVETGDYLVINSCNDSEYKYRYPAYTAKQPSQA